MVIRAFESSLSCLFQGCTVGTQNVASLISMNLAMMSIWRCACNVLRLRRELLAHHSLRRSFLAQAFRRQLRYAMKKKNWPTVLFSAVEVVARQCKMLHTVTWQYYREYSTFFFLASYADYFVYYFICLSLLDACASYYPFFSTCAQHEVH